MTNVSIVQEDGSRETFEELYLAVCGVDDGRSAVKLCLIDAIRLEIQKESKETLAAAAGLLELNGNYYTVIQRENGFHVAVYDKNLTLRAESAEAVKAGSPLNETDRGLLVTGAGGAPLLLNVQTLAVVWEP